MDLPWIWKNVEAELSKFRADLKTFIPATASEKSMGDIQNKEDGKGLANPSDEEERDMVLVEETPS